MLNYNHKEVEKKWQEKWEKDGLYKTSEDTTKPKYFILDMFPYPSGEGLHVGHPKGYIATDIFARLKKMQGYNVLHPMGWDAFGLPTENYALKHKVHPRIATAKNIDTFKKQLLKIGFSYDWEREINTTDPEFYKWTQWAFLKMFERGLAFESFEPIIWCPSCKTGLSMEDLEGHRCERCDSEVERKPMRQWVLRITDYADRLLADLDKLPDWEHSIKEMQRNWIGKSTGAIVKFAIVDCRFPNEKKIEQEIFTTRPDTLFGATYFVVAPEHPLISDFRLSISNFNEVEEYMKKAGAKSDMERTELNKEKTGVKIEGLVAINPVNGEELPIFVADYVMMGYGTGAIMAVPAHDERDFEFAKKYNIKIKPILHSYLEFWNESEKTLTRRTVNPTSVNSGNKIEDEELLSLLKQQAQKDINKDPSHAITDYGWLFDSGFLNGYYAIEAKEKMIAWLTEKGLGKRAVNYKIKDWVFSRQRYWGEPIPIVHCEKCGAIPVPESELPLRLPDVEHYEPSGTGESPLATIPEWVNTKCPKCGGAGKRETNTMPQWAGSSWYYLRFIDPKNNNALIDIKKDKYWSPVDFYVGGAEHATRHLIYARFWHKFLFDIGAVNYEEPFTRLQHVGLIMAEDGRKMSKRWGNVINPNDIVEKYGADALRVYEMFMGPFSQSVAWSTNGLVGARKFLERIYNMQHATRNMQHGGGAGTSAILNLLHKTIKKVGEDILEFKFNTAISAMMILVNALEKEKEISRDTYEKFLIILAPFAPHITEEIWSGLGNSESIFKQSWPKYDPELIKDEKIQMVIQVNGKLRDTIEVDANISEEDAKKIALESEKVKKFIDDKEIMKVIFVGGKLVNVVVK